MGDGAAGTDAVVVDVVVDAAVVVVGCGWVVVVVALEVLVEVDALVATVVVTNRPCRRNQSAEYRRRAEATGTEIASITVTAVSTTTIVRSLRLILFPLFCGWNLPRRSPNGTRDVARGRAGAGRCGAPAGAADRALGANRAGRGPNMLDHDKPGEYDVAAISG